MPKTEILYETYLDLKTKNVPGLSEETVTTYYLDTAPESVEEPVSEEAPVRTRKSPKVKRLKSDRLSLVHGWEFRIGEIAWEYRDYVRHMAKVLDQHNGWLTSIELTRAMFALDLGPTIDCVSGRNGTLIDRGILEVNAPFTKAVSAVRPPQDIAHTPILQFPFSIPDPQVTAQ